MSTLVLVDFDHTLYKKDSLLEFTQYYCGKQKFYFGLLQLIPTIFAWKLGFTSNEKAKKKYFQHFFKNEDYRHFSERGRLFAQSKIPIDLDPILLNKIKSHLECNDNVYIITASFPEWINAWAVNMNIGVIGTHLEEINGIVTGNFNSKNCYGKEKVNRIKKEIDIDTFTKICVYGKGKGDREMLQLQK